MAVGSDAYPLHAAPQDTVTARATEVAQLLQSSFAPILRSCVGGSTRPATLARALEIDRTLAARLLRSQRATDAAQILHEIPAPGGLRIILEAATAIGTPAALIDRARAAVRVFEQLIDEFPDGRAALDAALGGINNRVLARNAKSAAQSIHRSMTSLLGYQAELMLATAIVQPSADGSSTDTVYVLGKYGVRRLRASSPITVFGWRADSTGTDPRRRRIETIDGRVQPELGSDYLIKEFCSKPAPPLSLYQTNDLSLYTLAANIPHVNSPVTVVGAQVVRNSGPRYQSHDTSFHWETHTPRFPCKVLLADVFVRDDVFVNRPPTLTTTLHSIASGASRPDAPAFQLDEVRIDPALQSLGRGIAGAATSDIPEYERLLGTVFGRMGWAADRFLGFRCRVQYPVPLVSLTFWFDLLAPPQTETR